MHFSPHTIVQQADSPNINFLLLQLKQITRRNYFHVLVHQFLVQTNSHAIPARKWESLALPSPTLCVYDQPDFPIRYRLRHVTTLVRSLPPPAKDVSCVALTR